MGVLRGECRQAMVVGLILVGGIWLAGCDNGGSAVETRQREVMSMSAVAPAPMVMAAAEVEAPAASFAAGPVVTSNRRETADAKIVRLYERNGQDFGAKSAKDFGDKIKAFTSRPPKGTEVVKRANGDSLYYQASTNTFAVVDRNGMPRTMFKPDNGPGYWADQKQTAATFGQYRGG